MRIKASAVAIVCIGLVALSGAAAGTPAPKNDSTAHAAKRPPLGWPALVVEARKYIGTNPTDRKRLWCATFMNFVLAKLGYDGTHSDAAKSFAYYGHRISEPRIGAIAVLTRGKNGGHVGVVSGIDANGNPIIISGNHNRTVGEGVYPRSRVIAYVMPTERRAGPAIASRTPPRAGGPAIDSPITELLAAIEAEQARAEVRKPERVAAPAAAAPVAPHRVVQQLPDQPRAGTLPLDPDLARFLGIKQNAPAPRAVPPRQQRVTMR